MYEDLLELLKEPWYWTPFTEKVWLQYEDHADTAHGLYDWMNDIHVFIVNSHGPDLIIACPGPLFASTWSFYSGDVALTRAFSEAVAHGNNILAQIRASGVL